MLSMSRTGAAADRSRHVLRGQMVRRWVSPGYGHGGSHRMVVILPEDRYDDWLQAGPDHGWAFFRPLPAEQLVASGPENNGGLF